MRNVITLSLLVFIISISMGQTRRMENSHLGKTFSTKNQNRSVQPLLQLAEQKFRLFDYDGTFLTLESAVAQNPNSPEALLMRAKLQRMVGMQAEAKADLRLANRINPMAANLYGYYGNNGLLQVMSIEPEKAIQGLNTFQKLDYYYPALDAKIADNSGVETNFEAIEIVIGNIENDQLEEGLSNINEILETSGSSAIAYDLKGVIYKKQGKLEEAKTAFTKALELEPDFAIAWYNFAQVETKLGNFDTAKTYLDRAITLQDNLTKAYFERALIFKKMGEKEDAIEDYDKIIEIKGEQYMEAFLNRGLTKKMLGDYNGALKDLNQAIEEFPYNAELFKNRGNLRLLFGLHRKAIDDYNEAISLRSDYAEAYYNRALTHFILYDKISGCADLDTSAYLGYEKALKAMKYFCMQY